MDRVETRCHLDWWANSVTLLGSATVSLVITSTETGWHAHGQLINDEDLEGFEFLCEMDPVFTLRFADESTIQVTVHPADDHREFTLAEYTGPAERRIDYQIDLRPPTDHRASLGWRRRKVPRPSVKDQPGRIGQPSGGTRHCSATFGVSKLAS